MRSGPGRTGFMQMPLRDFGCALIWAPTTFSIRKQFYMDILLTALMITNGKVRLTACIYLTSILVPMSLLLMLAILIMVNSTLMRSALTIFLLLRFANRECPLNTSGFRKSDWTFLLRRIRVSPGWFPPVERNMIL